MLCCQNESDTMSLRKRAQMQEGTPLPFISCSAANVKNPPHHFIRKTNYLLMIVVLVLPLCMQATTTNNHQQRTFIIIIITNDSQHRQQWHVMQTIYAHLENQISRSIWVSWYCSAWYCSRYTMAHHKGALCITIPHRYCLAPCNQLLGNMEPPSPDTSSLLVLYRCFIGALSVLYRFWCLTKVRPTQEQMKKNAEKQKRMAK